jgi:hypothetical protein
MAGACFAPGARTIYKKSVAGQQVYRLQERAFGRSTKKKTLILQYIYID